MQEIAPRHNPPVESLHELEVSYVQSPASHHSRLEHLRILLARPVATLRHDAAAIEEAARRFDLSPADEEFLLQHCRSDASAGMDIHPLREDADSGPAGEE